MTIKDLQTLYDYDDWANHVLFTSLAQLTDEEFTRTVGGSYGSIRNTLVHALSAQWGWLDRCGGAQRGPALKPDDYPTLGSVKEQWSRVAAFVREFLSSLKDDDLTRNVEFTLGGTYFMPIGELLHHGANHAIHHRGQVAMMVRMLGHSPGNFDILGYYAEKPGVGRTTAQ